MALRGALRPADTHSYSLRICFRDHPSKLERCREDQHGPWEAWHAQVEDCEQRHQSFRSDDGGSWRIADNTERRPAARHGQSARRGIRGARIRKSTGGSPLRAPGGFRQPQGGGGACPIGSVAHPERIPGLRTGRAPRSRKREGEGPEARQARGTHPLGPEGATGSRFEPRSILPLSVALRSTSGEALVCRRRLQCIQALVPGCAMEPRPRSLACDGSKKAYNMATRGPHVPG